ncbi:MAG: Holliday junction resolvase-like protein [archaeon]|nr:Holliday junction resolvase-like protein [archaeon]
MTHLELILIILILTLIIYLADRERRYKELTDRFNVINKDIRSLRIRFGKQIEEFIPFFDDLFPYDRKKFYALGQPIDGIYFGDDRIVFLEFKSGNAGKTQMEKKIENLVKAKKVEFKEIRYNYNNRSNR